MKASNEAADERLTLFQDSRNIKGTNESYEPCPTFNPSLLRASRRCATPSGRLKRRAVPQAPSGCRLESRTSMIGWPVADLPWPRCTSWLEPLLR